jgi:hypothetical protein
MPSCLNYQSVCELENHFEELVEAASQDRSDLMHCQAIKLNRSTVACSALLLPDAIESSLISNGIQGSICPLLDITEALIFAGEQSFFTGDFIVFDH